jgi:predicted transcriptional regulator
LTPFFFYGIPWGMNPTIARLLAEIQRFLAKTGLSRSEFGHKAVNDRSFIFDLEQGREPRWATIERAKKFRSTL